MKTLLDVLTEARRRGIESALAKGPAQIAPYKILPAAVKGIQEVVTARLRLFSFQP